MSDQLVMPDEVLKKFVKTLQSKVDNDGKRIYTDEQIVEIVEKFENMLRDNKFKLVKKD